ncbi:MAG: hypothetical protein QM765_49540 [Myxococcales bacterium]
MRAAMESAVLAGAERGLAAEVERRRGAGGGWAVERHRGQPPLAALAHGLVAAALATLTDALVVSVDDAWDEALWPCDGAALARAFMRPESTAADHHRRAAEAMLREVVPALSPFDDPFVCQLVEELLARLVAEVNAVRGDAAAEAPGARPRPRPAGHGPPARRRPAARARALAGARGSARAQGAAALGVRPAAPGA